MENSNNPLVSIIVPCFQAENTIIRALSSIEDQLYKNIEVFIIDDFSSDHTVELVENYIENKQKFKIIKLNKNMGAGRVRTLGLNKSSGKYIAFLDADDFWNKNKLSYQVDILEKDSNIIIVQCNYNVINIKGENIAKIKPPRKINFLSMHFSNFIATSATMFRSELKYAKKMSSIRRRQDYAFWINILKNNKGFAYTIPKFLCSYTKVKGSLSSSGIKNLAGNFKMFNEVLEYNFLISILLVSLNTIFSIKKKLGLFLNKILKK